MSMLTRKKGSEFANGLGGKLGNMAVLRIVGLTWCLLGLLLHGCATTPKEQPIYLVKIETGDTLAGIAKKYDTTWQDIWKLNSLTKSKPLKVGQILRVQPGPGGVVAGSSVAAVGSSSKKKRVVPIKRRGLLFGSSKEKPAKKSAKSRSSLRASNIYWPLSGRLTSKYGRRWGRFHHGIDISGRKGLRFFSAARGEVTFVGWKRGYGKTIVVEHDGLKTLYAHCSRILVSRGEWVNIGQAIGRVGTTGNARGSHLHFEVRDLKNRSLDPLKFLKYPRRLASAKRFGYVPEFFDPAGRVNFLHLASLQRSAEPAKSTDAGDRPLLQFPLRL